MTSVKVRAFMAGSFFLFQNVPRLEQFLLALLAHGRIRSLSFFIVSRMMSATASRVNHLWSAGMTYHGAMPCWCD